MSNLEDMNPYILKDEEAITILTKLEILSPNVEHRVLRDYHAKVISIVNDEGTLVAKMIKAPEGMKFGSMVLKYWSKFGMPLRVTKATYTKTVYKTMTLGNFLTPPDEMGYQFHKPMFDEFESLQTWYENTLVKEK